MERSNRVRSALLLLATMTCVFCSKALRAEGEVKPAVVLKLPYTFDFDAPDSSQASLMLDGQLPEVGRTMMVYKVKDPCVTEAYVRELGRKHLGMSGNGQLKRSRRMGLYWLTGPSWRLEVDPASGFFTATKSPKNMLEGTTMEDHGSKEGWKNIAEDFLNRNKLASAEGYFRGVVDNTRGAGVVSVGFGRKIDGHETWGAGGEIGVHIDKAGEVVSVRKAWQALVPFRSYPIKTVQEALEELRKGNGVLMHGSKGTVKEITLRYYTSPQKQRYVQPIYYFDCNGPEGRFYGVVPAIKDEYLEPPEDTSAPTWMMCRNTECQAEYEIKLKEYVAAVAEFVKAHPNSPVPPSLVCEKCGKDSAYRAIKCAKCGLVFEAGWKGPDYYDRCPQCKFSKTEERKKRTNPKRKG